MEEVEIKKRLYQLADTSIPLKMEQEIAQMAIHAVDPIQYLLDSYRNKGLKHDLHREFFESYQDEILVIIDQSKLKVRWMMNSKNYMTELSFLAYQLRLERMIVHFGLIATDQTFYANYDILDVHAELDQQRTVRYGISDVILPAGQEPSKYVQVCDNQGKMLAEAEVYFIEDEVDENNE